MLRTVMSSIMRRRRGLISAMWKLLSEGWDRHPHPLRQETRYATKPLTPRQRLRSILPGERDMAVFDRDEAAVGDRDAVGIAAEIRERLGGSAEGPFGVDHPGGGAHVGDERVEPHGLGQTGLIAEEPQSARVERVL